MSSQDLADKKLKGMLKASELPVKASYTRAQVCQILGISERTFFRYVALHEIEDGQPVHPWTLDSYMTKGHHRVRYDELVSYLQRNRTYERKNAADPRQMDMFDSA